MKGVKVHNFFNTDTALELWIHKHRECYLLKTCMAEWFRNMQLQDSCKM